MSATELLLQQLITGLANGFIIALIALGYTLVYGIVELVNFAHGDLFMLGAFFALTMLSLLFPESFDGAQAGALLLAALFLTCAVFCALVNFLVDRYAYRAVRNSPRLVALVSALGVSFIFLNIGIFWGGLPLPGFSSSAAAAAAPKDFPMLLSSDNWLGESAIYLTSKDLLVVGLVLPLLLGLSLFIRYTQFGKAMRAVSQDRVAAQLMGINVDRVISLTFALGGALAGVASVMYAIYNNTIFFQMGYRVGIDAFAAAVLGGIGSLPGAVLGGVGIGLIRALSDGYLEARWTNVVVFALLIGTLLIKPTGLFGHRGREKV
jgi:branched-chain amino acid transport system permease protein